MSLIDKTLAAYAGLPTLDAKVLRFLRHSQRDRYKHGRVLGAIIGQVEMLGCVTHSNDRWFFGPYGFAFQNAWRWDRPLAYKGQRGIFNVPDNALDNVLEG